MANGGHRAQVLCCLLEISCARQIRRLYLTSRTARDGPRCGNVLHFTPQKWDVHVKNDGHNCHVHNSPLYYANHKWGICRKRRLHLTCARFAKTKALDSQTQSADSSGVRRYYSGRRTEVIRRNQSDFLCRHRKVKSQSADSFECAISSSAPAPSSPQLVSPMFP
jgi:hypothetical protein